MEVLLRLIPYLATILALASAPALAQTQDQSPGQTPGQTQDQTTAPPPKHHHHHTGQRPIDVGPNTPEANGAYQGGGVVLQGAPGAPAPTPQATRPGQVPQGAVPR